MFAYDTFVVSFSSCLDDYSIVEIESLLLSQESQIEKHHIELDSASVNLATENRPFSNSNSRNSPHPFPGQNSFCGTSAYFGGRGNGRSSSGGCNYQARG